MSQRYPPPWCVCVNAVDKGVSGRFGVKALDKGLMAPGDCGNRFSGGEKEGLDGDTRLGKKMSPPNTIAVSR